MTDEQRQQTAARIGRRVRDLREHYGLNQQELADRAGIQRSHISRIEQGRYDVTASVIDAIARALGLTLDIIVPPLAGLLPPRPKENPDSPDARTVG